MKDKKCLICAKEFQTKSATIRRGYGKYCSRACTYQGNPQMVGGFWTGKKRPNLMKTGANKTMFKKGFTPWNKGKKGFLAGEAHYNWKGGITTENHKIRTSTEYIIWRTAVFMRDGYICQGCGQKGGELQVDHIKPFSLYPELRLAIDNGRTLCKQCHLKTDTWGAKLKNYAD